MKYLTIEFNGNQLNRRIFITFSNLAFANNTITYNSSYKFYFSLFSRVIYYKAVKGNIVTTLSTKAELLALSLTKKEFV
jgi:hypothetical protein